MYDVAIIGCGCAGMTAAIYAKRSNMNAVIIEDNAPGGQINKSSIVENYPGYKSIDGPTLAYNMFNQLQSMDIEYKYGKVTNIDSYDDKKVITTSKEVIEAKSVIIATGRQPKKLGIENEDKLSGKGISFCAICDGNLYKNKEVAIIGGGNSALEESLYLSEITKKVTIINRSDILRADEKLQNEIKKRKNIKVIYNASSTKFLEKDNKLYGVEIKDNKTKKTKQVLVDGVFIFIGYEPVSDFCKNLNITDNYGYIIVNDKMETKIPLIYACGDVIKKQLYQIVTSVSEGAIAATNAKKHVI